MQRSLCCDCIILWYTYRFSMDHDLQIDQWVDVRLLTIMVTEEAILLVTRINVKISLLHYFRNMFVVVLPVVTIQAHY